MSIIGKLRSTRSTRSQHGVRGNRALARAVATAPTRASREELLQLQNMGR